MMDEQKAEDCIKKAKQTTCSVSGITYQDALSLISDMRKAGIEADITVGGVSINAHYKDERMLEVCKQHNVLPESGLTRIQEEAFYPTVDKGR